MRAKTGFQGTKIGFPGGGAGGPLAPLRDLGGGRRPPLNFDHNHSNLCLFVAKPPKFFALRAKMGAICYEMPVLSSFHVKFPNFLALRAILEPDFTYFH